jgi:hypothetical protein
MYLEEAIREAQDIGFNGSKITGEEIKICGERHGVFFCRKLHNINSGP